MRTSIALSRVLPTLPRRFADKSRSNRHLHFHLNERKATNDCTDREQNSGIARYRLERRRSGFAAFGNILL